MRRSLLILIGLVLAVVGTAAPAGAHAEAESIVYLDVTDRAVAGRVQVPASAVAEYFDLDLNQFDLEPVASDVVDYLAEHLVIVGPDGPIGLEFDAPAWLDDGPEDHGDVGGIVEASFVAVTSGDIPRSFEVTFDPFFDDLGHRVAFLAVSNDIAGGVHDNTDDFAVAFVSDQRTRTVDLGDASAWTNLVSSVGLGIDHIKTGPDHILFVLALLLPSVLVFTGAWTPVDSFGDTLWRILKIVTMFTVAHSITFTLAGLDLMPVPASKVTEAVIAVSIALAALHSIWPIAPNREWALAFGFGLFHGMGFASLVSGIEASREVQLVSLIGRNIGIEIGQAVVVLVCFPALYLLRRTRYYLPAMTVASVALAGVAIGWSIERVAEIDLGINTVAEPVLETPRAFVLAAAATVAAAVVHRREDAAGRLTTGPARAEQDSGPEPVAVS